MKKENNNKGMDFETLKRSIGGSSSNSFRELHQAECAKCKSKCEVPFKPTAGRPVYCRNCFSKK